MSVQESQSKVFISHLTENSQAVGYVSVRHNPSGVWYGFGLTNSSSVSVGRNSNNDIELVDSLVSRKHFEIFPVIIDDSQLETPLFFIRDRASDNGTTVNRIEIGGYARGWYLHNGDIIRLQDWEFCFVQYRQASAKWTPEQGEDFETLAPTYIISRKLLGEGAQAKVYVGFDTCRNCQVACKEISLGCHRKEAASIRKRSRLESSILRKLNHPNVLRFEYAATTEKTWYLLTSLSTGGDLFSFMTKTDINETVIRTIILQIVMGLVHIHDKGIVHRDIKPENIQFSVAPKVTYPVVIADFGHATFLRRGKMLTSMAGTTPFRAPEIHYHEPYDFAVDIWALGITILTMLMPNHLDTFGKLFSYSQEGVDSSLERVFKHSKIKIRRNGRSFIRACLRIDAKERMSSNEALKHSWINYKNHDMRVVYKRVMSRWRQCPPRVDMANNIPASQTPGAQPENLAFPKNGSSHSKKSFPKEEVQDVATNLPWSDTLPLSLREAAEKPNSTATTLEPTHCSSCEQSKSKSWQ